MSYQPRIVDAVLARDLGIAGAVLIEGARACGKTETGRHHSASAVQLDVDDQARQLAQLDPSIILEGSTPRLIDEWQLEPQLWNHVRREVDDRGVPGQFLLAGSSTPTDDATRHSGAGRILRLRMRTMSLFESTHSTGEVSLTGLLEGKAVQPVRSTTTLADITDRLSVGGWPGMQHLEPEAAQRLLRSYLDDVARADIQHGANATVRRDPIRVRRTLASYARHISTPASLATIAADTAGADQPQVKVDTVREYLAVLESIMIVDEQPNWGPHLRSRDVVRKAALRHFVDPSLAVAALGAGPERLLRDPRTLGLLFESLVIRDLRAYVQPFDGEVMHYRDSAGVEADAIVQLRDGRWAAVEVKLGESQVDAAARSLTVLLQKIDTARAGEPAARIVVTAGGYAYTRPDGIHVVPIGCLGP